MNIPIENKLTIHKISISDTQKITVLERKSESSTIKLGSMNSFTFNVNETKHNAIAIDRPLTDQDKDSIKNVLQDHFLFKDQYCNIM